MAYYTELYMDLGSDFQELITFTDDETGNYINVAGYIITSAMKPSYYSSNVTNLICTIVDSANGNVSISLPANAQYNLTPRNYVFDVKAQIGSTTIRFIEGTITVTPSVT